MPFIFDREKTQKARYAMEWSGGTFFFRLLNQRDKEDIYEQSAKRGNVNWMTYRKLNCARALVGWDQVLDGNDEPIPFNRQLIEYFPEQFFQAFQDRYYDVEKELVEEQEGLEKNSESTSLDGLPSL